MDSVRFGAIQINSVQFDEILAITRTVCTGAVSDLESIDKKRRFDRRGSRTRQRFGSNPKLESLANTMTTLLEKEHLCQPFLDSE